MSSPVITSLYAYAYHTILLKWKQTLILSIIQFRYATYLKCHGQSEIIFYIHPKVIHQISVLISNVNIANVRVYFINVFLWNLPA